MNYFARRRVTTRVMPETFRGIFRVVHERRGEMINILDDVEGKFVETLDACRQTDTSSTNRLSS